MTAVLLVEGGFLSLTMDCDLKKKKENRQELWSNIEGAGEADLGGEGSRKEGIRRRDKTAGRDCFDWSQILLCTCPS